jgi:hypothetical protein
MVNKKCKKAPGDGVDTYYCYFEFAFNVAGITQAHYYFEVSAEIDLETDGMLKADLVEITQIDMKPRCEDDGEPCRFDAESTLMFCENRECTNP